MLQNRALFYVAAGIMILDGCTKLDERFLGDTTQGALASNSAHSVTEFVQ